MKHITPNELAEKLKIGQEVVLLDVRTPQEYDEMHLKNAMLLPLQQLSEESLEARGLGNSVREKEIVIYCRSGGRSLAACSYMSQLGYTNVKNLTGGYLSYETSVDTAERARK